MLVVALIAGVLASMPGNAMAAGPPVFINEIHYDNAGGDIGEGFEIAGPAGTNLAGWSVVLYNGNGGAVYNTVDLSGFTIPDQQAGFGTVSYDLPSNGLQNGSPDGLALVDAASALVEFLSYEGSFTAVGGTANGVSSTDIGVSEPGTTLIGHSLQLGGSGTGGGDFSWSAAQSNTFGAVNTGQTFGVVTGPSDPMINEFVVNHTGADSGAFVEVLGDSSTDYSAYTVLEIEGDGASISRGSIDAALPVGTTSASGYWVDPEDMENGTVTILLVEGFTGSVGNDLDADDDGTFDSAPWTRIVDDIATTDGGASDISYSSSVLAAFFDGSPFGPGGASRIPNGTDTDTAADWMRNDFDGFGLAGLVGSPAIGEAENTPGAVNSAISVAIDPVGVCTDPATFIHDIQGAGMASGDVGSIREIEGVVVGDFQGGTGLNGFNVQEEDADADADALTSEGIFVFDSANAVALDVGDVVRVRGAVAEFNGLTEMNNVEAVIDCGVTDTASASTVTLPVGSIDDFEATEGMAVNFHQTLLASGNFTQARFGEVDLSVGGAQDNPTNVVAPGAAANALQDLNNRSRIQLEDGSTAQNPLPLPPYLGAGNTLRTGDSVTGLTGVMSYGFGLYEVHPTAAVDFTRVNTRPAVPTVGGTIQVAAYNVLNYFTTIDGAGSICGPLGNQGCRGADTASEFTRQRDKLVTAISKLDADVVGLMEIENHPGDVPTADLVAGLNAATAPGTYDFIATGAIGTDAIRQAVIYQPAAVTPIGSFEVLDSSDIPTFDDDRNRPMVVQTFRENASGAVFTVAVNHLKSKGSNCNSIGDPDVGDGQGNCNVTRTVAAQAIVDYLATDPTGSGDTDFLIVGDLNAYAMEDPVTTIEAAGYTDLLETFVGTGVGAGAYSFNFFSQSGYLDHGLSSASLVSQVTGAGFWHVNADEPSGLDYNNFNQAGLYNPDEFRSSDHDPVLVGLELAATPMQSMLNTIVDLGALLPTGDSKSDKAIGKAIDAIEDSLDPEYWADDGHLTAEGKKVFDREKKAVEELGKVKGPASTTTQAVIATLIGIDEALAQSAIDIAIAVDGEQREIDKALSEMSKAAADLAAGKHEKAIERYKDAWKHATKAVKDVRFATYNASLNRSGAGDLVAELSVPGSPQPAAIAEIIQHSRPNVLLVNEFDFDASGTAAAMFQTNYLSVSQGGADPIEYPFRYTAPSNTGIFSGFDLDNSGAAGDFAPNDSFGFGFFPGQFGMVVYSMFPIDMSEVRTFQNFLWKDMPGALLPEDPPGTPWYSPDELDVFRLSSKSHWDLPLVVGGETVHFLTSHPTPPVFDGAEDRNGTRNHDEIRFWADYIRGGGAASYIYDDNGGSGGLARGETFVIAGDQNSDPYDGDSIPGAIQQLLDNPMVNDKDTPSSAGATEQSGLQGGINTSHISDPAFDTADFSDSAPGNLRADYVLPHKSMKITDSGVFWPLSTDPLFPLVGTFPFPTSDHRLVWIDTRVR